MTPLAELWLPIVLTAVLVFIAGAVMWMALPHHHKDWVGVPGEEALMNTLRANGVKSGQFMFPFLGCGKESRSEEAKAKMKQSPSGVMIVWDGMPSMGKAMALTFVFNLVVAALIAYVASIALAPGAAFVDVARVVGTTGLLAYIAGQIPFAIWFRKSGRSVAADVFDGVVYTALAVLAFGFLWPSAPTIGEAIRSIGG